MPLRTTIDQFLARDLERAARAEGDLELAEIYRQYGRNRLIAVIGLAWTLVLIAMSVAQLLFNYGRPMPWWVLVIFLIVALGALTCSGGVLTTYLWRRH